MDPPLLSDLPCKRLRTGLPIPLFSSLQLPCENCRLAAGLDVSLGCFEALHTLRLPLNRRFSGNHGLEPRDFILHVLGQTLSVEPLQYIPSHRPLFGENGPV